MVPVELNLRRKYVLQFERVRDLLHEPNLHVVSPDLQAEEVALVRQPATRRGSLVVRCESFGDSGRGYCRGAQFDPRDDTLRSPRPSSAPGLAIATFGGRRTCATGRTAGVLPSRRCSWRRRELRAGRLLPSVFSWHRACVRSERHSTLELCNHWSYLPTRRHAPLPTPRFRHAPPPFHILSRGRQFPECRPSSLHVGGEAHLLEVGDFVRRQRAQKFGAFHPRCMVDSHPPVLLHTRIHVGDLVGGDTHRLQLPCVAVLQEIQKLLDNDLPEWTTGGSTYFGLPHTWAGSSSKHRAYKHGASAAHVAATVPSCCNATSASPVALLSSAVLARMLLPNLTSLSILLIHAGSSSASRRVMTTCAACRVTGMACGSVRCGPQVQWKKEQGDGSPRAQSYIQQRA